MTFVGPIWMDNNMSGGLEGYMRIRGMPNIVPIK